MRSGERLCRFTLFDQNVLMLLYIYLTAQLQHSEVWDSVHRRVGAPGS